MLKRSEDAYGITLIGQHPKSRIEITETIDEETSEVDWVSIACGHNAESNTVLTVQEVLQFVAELMLLLSKDRE